MAYKPFKELMANLDDAAKQVEIGAHYIHYKHPDRLHEVYEVTGFTILEATGEVAVKYLPFSTPEVEFTRPLESWLGQVEVNGETVPRFRKDG